MKRIFTTLFLFMNVLGLISQTLSLDTTFNQESREPIYNPQVSISLYEKEIYTQNSEIHIQVQLTNPHSVPLTLNLADERKYNITVEMRKVQSNQGLGSIEALGENFDLPASAAFYRQTTLMPGESLSFKVILGDYVMIKEPGLYSLRLRFFPLLNIKFSQNHVSSNILSLHIRPETDDKERMVFNQLASARSEYRKDSRLSPDGVVKYIIEAKQNENREQFFLYLDLESLIQGNSNFWSEYRGAGENRRRELLENFSEILWEDNSEITLGRGEMFEVPSDFHILSTNYTPDTGQVKARLEFQRGRVAFIREYEFFLKKDNDVWMITQYTVRNAGNRRLD